MSTSDKQFAGGIPDIYERLMVPLIFAPYARDLAARAAALAPLAVLETAAGTGALTRALADGLGKGARIAATDLNQPMLDRAARSLGGGDRVVWQQADALALPFAAQSFDLVACQFGVMFFPDKVKAHLEVGRVLRPGGRYLFSVWAPVAENDFAALVEQTVAALFPDDPPRFFSRTPHGYANAETIRADLDAAGFGAVEIEPVGKVSRARSARDVATAFCQGTPLRNEIEARDPAGLETVTRKVEEALAARFGHGAVEGRIKALVVTAAR